MARRRAQILGRMRIIWLVTALLFAALAVAVLESRTVRAAAPDGAVWAWGRNENGQLGDGTTAMTTTSGNPALIGGFDGVAAVAVGGSHVLALRDGAVWAWGGNNSGQVGDGTTDTRTVPVPVSVPGTVIAIAAGSHHSVALTVEGVVYVWGFGVYPASFGEEAKSVSRTPVPKHGLDGVTAIAAGQAHSLAVKADGTVWAWGDNIHGQLGHHSADFSSSVTPLQVTGLGEATANAVAGSLYNSYALLTDGTVRAWGDGGSGQLGNGVSSYSHWPIEVSGLGGVSAIAAGAQHALAVRADGTVWAWGDNGRGQLGDGTQVAAYTPVRVGVPGGIVAVAAGYTHSLALKSDGTVWSWGDNQFGQLGNGLAAAPSGSPVPGPTGTGPRLVLTPAQIATLGGIGGIGAGGFVNLAAAGTSTAATVAAGGTVTTDPTGTGPTPENPVTTAVTSPTGGVVSIIQMATTAPAPTGYAFSGEQLLISAPDGTEAQPLRLVFALDAAAIPIGQDASTLEVFRNGVAVPACTGPTDHASPSPCVAAREPRDGGGAQVTVLTIQASRWNLGARAPRFLAPLKAGTVNSFKVGSTIPVKLAGPAAGRTVTLEVLVGNQTAGQEAGTTSVVPTSQVADSTGRFRYDSGCACYLYNLSTKAGFTPGSEYTLVARVDGLRVAAIVITATK